jgi:hypothetical protein
MPIPPILSLDFKDSFSLCQLFFNRKIASMLLNRGLGKNNPPAYANNLNLSKDARWMQTKM